MSGEGGCYHGLALRACDAWERLIEAPDSAEAEAEVAALEDRLTALESDILGPGAGPAPATPAGGWPEWLLEMVGVSTGDGKKF